MALRFVPDQPTPADTSARRGGRVIPACRPDVTSQFAQHQQSDFAIVAGCQARTTHSLIAMHRRTLAAAISCGAIAVLGSGCQLLPFQKGICVDLKDQFESSQEMLSKRFKTRGVTYGLKPEEVEAAIKEDLKPTLSTTAFSGRYTTAQDHLRIQAEVRRVEAMPA